MAKVVNFKRQLVKLKKKQKRESLNGNIKYCVIKNNTILGKRKGKNSPCSPFVCKAATLCFPTIELSLDY